MKLETSRLVIETPAQNDLIELNQVLAESAVLKASGLTLPEDRQQRLLAIQLLIRSNHVLAIRLKQPQWVIGMIILSRCYNKTGLLIPNQYELGYLLSSIYWRQGLMTEALQVVLTVVPARIKVVAKCTKENFRSRRVLEKCGFSTSGDGNYCYQD